MKRSSKLDYKDISTKTRDFSPKKESFESPVTTTTSNNFQKTRNNIALVFVDVDQRLRELAEVHRQGNISKVRHFILLQEIRNSLFELCNLCLYNLDIHEFAIDKKPTATAAADDIFWDKKKKQRDYENEQDDDSCYLEDESY
jgi:hypothetical protein